MILITDYNPAWPGEFAALAKPLARALDQLALAIDHIGSTAVPGLAAKDKIDIQLTIADLSAFAAVQAALEPLGYTLSAHTCDHIPPSGPFEPEQWEKRFFNPPAGQRPTNLHVRVEGCANQRYPILFRDYLRANPAAARAYENLKRQLASYHSNNIEAYCDIKDPACDLIIVAAEAWARETGWRSHPEVT